MIRRLLCNPAVALALLAAWAGPAAGQQAPAAPTDFIGYRSAASTVTLQWVDPEDSTITKYQVQYQSGNCCYNAWADLAGTGASSTTAMVSSLSDTARYFFRVRACAGSTCGGHAEEWLEMTRHQVTSTTITSRPRAGDTYTVGEIIEVTLHYHDVRGAIWRSRAMLLPIQIGANERRVGSGTGTIAHPFRYRYTVGAADLDADGISVTEDLSGAPGNIWGSSSQLVRNLGRHRIVNDPSHKVNGALTAPAAPTGLTAEPGLGQVTLRWTDPELSSLGAYQVRHAQASGSYPATWTTISGSDATTTEHTVTSLTNETEYKFQIRAQNGAGFGPAAEVMGTPTATPVVSGVDIASAPASGDTYGAGEAVLVDVEFSAPLTPPTTGMPRLVLTVGTATRQAIMTSVAASSLRFRYIVAATDADTDGIGIAANALTLNGATLAGTDGRTALLGLGTHAFTADADHKVDGSSATAPSVSAVRIASSPVTGSDTYGGGERIDVEVAFAAAVPIAVSGSPRLAIGMDRGSVYATLASTSGQLLRFSYVVQTSALDVNGISIAASALELNGGAIRSLVGTNANLGLGSHAISNASNHKVVGSSLTQPTVTAISITSSPVSGDTYRAGEAIRVEATFNLPVTVTGAPQATLTIGNVEMNAAYQAGSGSTTLAFRYVVRGGDRDADGLSILALTLNSGTVQSSVGANASLSLTGRSEVVPLFETAG